MDMFVWASVVNIHMMVFSFCAKEKIWGILVEEHLKYPIGYK